MSIFSIDDLCLAFGTHVLLDHASFSLERGERVCLIGRNGTGKNHFNEVDSRRDAP